MHPLVLSVEAAQTDLGVGQAQWHNRSTGTTSIARQGQPHRGRLRESMLALEKGAAMTEERPPPETHCEHCGVEYEVNEERRVPRKPARVPSRAEEPPPETLARCEFCGAEYTAPEERDG